MDLRHWKALEKDKQGEEQGIQPCEESKGTSAKIQGGIFLKRRDAGVGRAVVLGRGENNDCRNVREEGKAFLCS